MLQAALKSKYRSANSGQFVYVYEVMGKPAEVEAYEEAKGEFNRKTEDGTPLFFLTEYDASGNKRLIEPKINLTITPKGNVVIDDLGSEQKLMAEVRAKLADKIADKQADNWIRRQERAAAVATTTTVKEQAPDPASLIDSSTPTTETEPVGETVNAQTDDISA